MSNLTAVAYYGGIPPNNNNPEKPLILNNFLQGVKNSGDNAIAHQGMNTLECDVAFIKDLFMSMVKLRHTYNYVAEQ